MPKDRTPIASREGRARVSDEIRAQRAEGRKPDQAVAIALSQERRGKLAEKYPVTTDAFVRAFKAHRWTTVDRMLEALSPEQAQASIRALTRGVRIGIVGTDKKEEWRGALSTFLRDNPDTSLSEVVSVLQTPIGQTRWHGGGAWARYGLKRHT